MLITFVTPFRVPLNLPLDRLLANNQNWIDLIADLQTRLPESGLPNPRLGNCAWGKPRDPIYRKGDPGWFFRDHYLLRFGDGGLACDPPLVGVETGACMSWECWFMNHTVGVLVLELEVGCEAFLQWVHEYPADYSAIRDQWSERALRPGSPVRQIIDRALTWCSEHLLAGLRKEICRGVHNEEGMCLGAGCLEHSPGKSLHSDEHLFGAAHPVYPQFYQALWVHPFYTFKADELAGDPERMPSLLTSLVPADQVPLLLKKSRMLLDGGGNSSEQGDGPGEPVSGNCFGWSASSRIVDPDAERQLVYGRQWLEGLCVMQYYYSCFEIADMKLPVLIARSRTESVRGRHARVLRAARTARNTLQILINSYHDLQVRAQSEAHEALQDYHRNWRLDALLSNVENKFTQLQDVISVASDAIDKKAESAIQAILSVITLLSFVGLVASLHQYLMGGYESRFLDPAHRFALSLSKGDIVIYSLLTVLGLFVMYVTYRFWRR